MVHDRDKLLIGAMKWLVNRDILCFHRFGPLVEGVERIKCFIYPLRGLFSSILRYNMLISFNSVSLRKSHTPTQLYPTTDHLTPVLAKVLFHNTSYRIIGVVAGLAVPEYA